MTLQIGGEQRPVAQLLRLIQFSPLEVGLSAHDVLCPGAVSPGELVVPGHTLIHLIQFLFQPPALSPEHIEDRGGTERPCALHADEPGRPAQQLQRPAMPRTHILDAVVLQEGEQQFHFSPQSVLLLLGQGALGDVRLDLSLHSQQFLIFSQEEQGKSHGDQGFGIGPFQFRRGALHQLQDHGPGVLIDDIGDVITGQGHGIDPFPRSRGVIKQQSMEPVLCLGCQFPAPQVNLTLAFLAELDKVALQQPTQLGVEVKTAAVRFVVDKVSAVHQQFFCLLQAQSGEARRLGQGKLGEDGNLQQEVLLCQGQAAPEHLLHQFVHAALVESPGGNEIAEL